MLFILEMQRIIIPELKTRNKPRTGKREIAQGPRGTMGAILATRRH